MNYWKIAAIVLYFMGAWVAFMLSYSSKVKGASATAEFFANLLVSIIWPAMAVLTFIAGLYRGRIPHN